MVVWHSGSAGGRGVLCRSGGCGGHVVVADVAVMSQQLRGRAVVPAVISQWSHGMALVVVVVFTWQAVVVHHGALSSRCITLWWQQ